MATLQEIFDLHYAKAELYQRFTGALISASWDVINEDPGTANHTNRIAYARKVLQESNPKLYCSKYWVLFLSNATIQTNGDASTDNDIQFVVNSFYDDMADSEAV